MERVNRNKLLWLKILLIVVVVALQLWTIVYQGNNKTYYDIDETSSYTLANNRDGMIWYDNYGWIHAGTFQKFGVTEGFNLGIVWENQGMDCHPPLFYTPMHAISAAIPGRLSPWIGVLPNVLYHLITLAAIGYIVHLVTKRYYAVICAVVLFGFNPSVLTYVNYVRMYAMANMWVTLFVATVIKLYYEQDKYDNLKIKGSQYKLWICLWAITALGGLTHYYFYIAAFFVSCIIGLYWLIKKRWGILAKYCVMVPAGILTALAIFPATISHLTSNVHSANAAENLLSANFADRMASFWKFSPFGGALTKVLAFTAILLILQLAAETYKKRSTGKKIELELGEAIGLAGVGTAMLYLSIVAKVATYVQQRYIVPTESIFIVAFFLVWLICYHSHIVGVQAKGACHSGLYLDSGTCVIWRSAECNYPQNHKGAAARHIFAVCKGASKRTGRVVYTRLLRVC